MSILSQGCLVRLMSHAIHPKQVAVRGEDAIKRVDHSKAGMPSFVHKLNNSHVICTSETVQPSFAGPWPRKGPLGKPHGP